MFFGSTRREFLTTASRVLASTAAAARRQRDGQSCSRLLPGDIGLSALPGAAFLPDSIPSDDLRKLAITAVDAGTQAGATYVDIRAAEQDWLQLVLPGRSPLIPDTEICSTFTYGIRVLVDGVWAFGHGTMPTADAVASAARNAVDTARRYATYTPRRVELAPAPAATGEWATPFKIDPFAVPLQEQAALLGAFRSAALRVKHGGDGDASMVTGDRGAVFRWARETRGFGSSEGALVIQRLRRSAPFVGGSGNLGMGDEGQGSVNLILPKYTAMSGGYETVMDSGLQDEIKALAEEAVRYAELPRRSLEVGRYPVVLDGLALAMTLGSTIGQALEVDRALGYEADASGTSYLSLSNRLLGTRITSSLLTVVATRALPKFCAVQWDDEGVIPEDYTVIREGRLIDYHTSRATATALRSWYEQQGQSIQSHGNMVASEPGFPVLVRSPHLTIAPAIKAAGIEDLCKSVTRGILIRGLPRIDTDQQLSSGTFQKGEFFQIERGKVVRRLEGNALQFNTSTFWKSLSALGDAHTVNDTTFEAYKGQPWHSARYSVSAPAGLVKDVNLISTRLRI